jgi:hypothetical protein
MRRLAREMGIGRNTIRKMLLHRCPQLYGPRSPRYPKLKGHIKTIDRLAGANVSSPPEFRLSVMEICRRLQHEEGYSGSYGAVKDYINKRFGPSRSPGIEVWNDAYKSIVSLEKSDAIDFMRMISCVKTPMLSPFRVQKFFSEAATLVKSRSDVSPQLARINGGIEWIHRVIRREIPLKALRKEFGSISDFPAIIEHLYESRLTHRNRAMAVLAHFYGVSDRTIALALRGSWCNLLTDSTFFSNGDVPAERLFEGLPAMVLRNSG